MGNPVSNKKKILKHLHKVYMYRDICIWRYIIVIEMQRCIDTEILSYRDMWIC